MPKASLPYQRIVLKLSGELLKGKSAQTLDEDVLERLSVEVAEIVQKGIQVIIVVGGGNIFRHSTHAHERMDRVTADYMGMLATMINGLALQDAFEQHGLKTRVMSALSSEKVVEPFIRRRALRHLEKGRVVIITAGTGNPFFTTDTAAVLRAAELKCDVLLKGTNVDGLYSADPRKDARATLFKQVDYQTALSKQLKVMDLTAFTLAEGHKLPIVIFNLTKSGNLRKAATGQRIGTLVSAH